MSNTDFSSSIREILQLTHKLANHQAPVFDSLKKVEAELRNRRKQFLGSYISVRELVLRGASLEDDVVNQFSDYLASRTVFHWSYQTDDAENFCFRFYRLMIYALAGGRVRGECIDDILRLAQILTANQRVFVTAMKSMLPDDMISELFEFIDTSDKAFIASPSFEDAVLGALCILLRVLPDPFATEEEED